MPWWARALTVAGALGLALGGLPAAAQLPFPAGASRPSAHVLDVPYLPQSELLCGGAALAMVERWWGRRGVYAEDFVSLVRPELRGILTTDLVAAARARGWETRAFDGTPEEVRSILEQGTPVVVLIRIAPDRYHYVVLLGWSDGRVTFHDPARAPSRSIDETEFFAEWDGAERWAMVLHPAVHSPAAAATEPVTSPPAGPADSLPCRPWLDRALDAVAADRLEEASELLSEAGRACPAEPLVLRELAGVRFKQRRLAEAIELSDRYLAQVPDDAHGWQLLAASRYLSGDREGALEAWNRVGRPTVDLIRIDGVEGGEVRFRVIADAIEVPHGSVLTPAHLALARRRIADLPALGRAAVDYQPVGGGLVEVRAVVAERPVLGPAWPLLAAGVLRAFTDQEVAVAIASPTGAGELWSGVWRWEHAHPRVAVRVDLPVRLGISGVIGVEGRWERYRFALDTAPQGQFEQSRRAGGVAFGGWISPALRPSAGLRVDRWSGAGDYLAFTAGTEFRAAGDRFMATTTVEYGQALTTNPSYTKGNVRAIWASSVGLSRDTWSARLGLDLASGSTPLGLWPAANADIPWSVPLRAHSVTSDGLLPGATTGRSMMHGGLTGDHPFLRVGPFTLAAGLFLDAAEVRYSADGSGQDRFYLDAGGGLRIAILDGHLGILRVDLATGLMDHATAVTVGMHQSWPPFSKGR
jgi:hypothetical protein